MALFTVAVWGTTFISTKVLLREFTPIEILLFRFLIGFAALCLVNHKRLRTKRREAMSFCSWLRESAVSPCISLWRILR